MLLDAILEEDRLLRRQLTAIPQELRDMPVSPQGLSFKETLAHIAYWDSFTVEFFTRKLDRASLNPRPPLDFEEYNRQALAAAATWPFGEVLARYLESTGSLTRFLGHHWDELTAREQFDLRITLKHRRQHRLSLEKNLEIPGSLAAEA
jgi:hypothetical protein